MSKILQTPTINSINAFDPAYETNIYFTYGDNQTVKNRAVITDNGTNSVVYDSTQESMRLYHTIPSDVLVPGKQYLIRIQVFDADGNYSNLSDAALFHCYSTPKFSFNEILDSDENVYQSANISLSIDYDQKENEEIKSVQFFEYSYDKALLKSSDVIYSPSETYYSFYSLKNNETYYFRATGETNHGMKLDTGFIKVNVSFFTIKANVLFQAENNYNGGYISLKSNIKDVGYKTENDCYEFKDGTLILKGNSVTYNDFTIEADFSLFVEAKQLPLTTFFTTDNGNISLEIVNVCGSYYCRLLIAGSNLVQYAPLPKAKLVTEDGYYITTDDSKLIQIINTSYDNDDFIVFEVKRQNGYYSLNAYYKSEISE